MRNPNEGEPRPIDKSYLGLIQDYKEKGYIRDGSPFWWSTDYTPDPRKYISFEEFQERLVHLGKRKIVRNLFPRDEKREVKDVYLYPNEETPIALLTLEINGENPKFLVTVRPYHKKEVFWRPGALSLVKDHQTKMLTESTNQEEEINLPDHFYPHIRGLFAERRGNHFFWYPIHPWPWERESFGKLISSALKKAGLSFLDIYDTASLTHEDRTYVPLWNEIHRKGQGLIDQKPTGINFEAKEVSAEEFLPEKEDNTNLLLYYPLRVEEFRETLALVIANQTHDVLIRKEDEKKDVKNRIRKPAVLGVYAENGADGYCCHSGIMPIRNRQFAAKISGLISADFGIQVDTVLFTPQKGRPKYERISP